MRKVSLTEYDRAMLKIAAGQSQGNLEELRKYVRADDALELSKIPDVLGQCDKSEPREFLMEDSDFEYVKKMFQSIATWPLGMSRAVIETTERLDAAKIAPKKGAVSLVEDEDGDED